jgi:hypothetical protein
MRSLTVLEKGVEHFEILKKGLSEVFGLGLVS